MSDKSHRQSLLKFHLETIADGPAEHIEGDIYEVVGDNNHAWDITIKGLCVAALRRIKALEDQLGRYSMDAGQADQRMAESYACREALGFDPKSDHVAPVDLTSKIAELRRQAGGDA